MNTPEISLLSSGNIRAIHDTTIKILRDTGVLVHNEGMLNLLTDRGAHVDREQKIARLPEEMVEAAIETAGKQYILYGRDPAEVARFGHGDLNLISSPGQFAWFDYKQNGRRREPQLDDARAAACLGDALEHITIVGPMAVPTDVPPAIRDVILTAELVKHSTKPTRCWAVSPASSRYVLEIYKAIAGGEEALRERPMTEMFLEPISPLQLPDIELDILKVFLECGQPASLGPMAMASGTAPTTLAGTLAQENAEILAGIVIIQALAPGTPVLYGGIPHIMDPWTSICVFGSPEQALMAVAMAQVGKHYGFPVYINVNLTDSKTLDIQAGMEKMSSFVTGMMAGADLFGHAGIVGTDHGGSLPWLVVDNEAASYAKRICRGFEISEETLAVAVINDVGPTGSFLIHDHTALHFREELWLADHVWTRDTYDGWEVKGRLAMGERVAIKTEEILANHEPQPVDPVLCREIDNIVAAARRELVK